jgi:hypothetical protein
MFRVLQNPHLIHTTPRVAKNKSNWKTTSGHCSGNRIIPDMAIYLFIYNSYNPLTDRESPPRKFCGIGIGNGFFFTDFSCSLHRRPIMYHACLFCDLSWPLHRLPITYNVCLDDDLSCFFLSYFQWFTMPTQIVMYLVFSPHISKINDASAECDLSRTLLRSPTVWPVWPGCASYGLSHDSSFHS